MKKKILAGMIILTLVSVFWGMHRNKGDRFDRAFEFYSQSGFSSMEIEQHIKGIDFDKPVSVFFAEQGDVYWQYQNVGGQGDYYTLPHTGADHLGISSSGRQVKCYQVVSPEVPMLKSTAADIEDTWSQSTAEKVSGGAIQLFSHCKNCFRQVECQD